MALNVQRLRDLTRVALENASTATDDQLRQIFAGGMDKLLAAVAAGRGSAPIFGLRSKNDFDSPTALQARSLHPDALKGMAALVYQLAQPFRPTLDYWSGGGGGGPFDGDPEEGFNIVLHWSSTAELSAQVAQLKNDRLSKQLEEAIAKIETAVEDKAEQILVNLAKRAEAQARSGQNFIGVMTLKEGVDFERPAGAGGKEECRIEWLGPVARAVWDACVDFSPAIQFWSTPRYGFKDENWVETGYEIVVHWATN